MYWYGEPTLEIDSISSRRKESESESIPKWPESFPPPSSLLSAVCLLCFSCSAVQHSPAQGSLDRVLTHLLSHAATYGAEDTVKSIE